MSIIPCPAFASLALLLAQSGLGTPEQLYEVHGQGGFLTPIGDLDRDGATDFLAGNLRAYSGRSGQVLFGFLWYPNVVEFDLAANLGDVTGDGVPDLLIGQDGGALVFSGAELLVPQIVRHAGRPGQLDRGHTSIDLPSPPPPHFVIPAPAGNMGWLGGVAVLDDLDGDGLPEVLLGWPDVSISRCPSDHPRITSGPTGGAVRIHSGLDGNVLHEDVRPQPGTAMGGIVAHLGDLDGDGLSDYAVGTRYIASSPYFCHLPGGNFLEVHSSASHALLWQVPETPRAVASIADTDGDGVEDVALGYPFSGRVELRSGRDGDLLRVQTDPLPPGLNLFGNSLSTASDPSGLGAPVLLVSAPQPLNFPFGCPGCDPWSSGPGAVVLDSFGRRPRVSMLTGDEVGEEFGSDVAFLGDVDGDHRFEIAIGIARAESAGVIRVLSLGHASRTLAVR